MENFRGFEKDFVQLVSAYVTNVDTISSMRLVSRVWRDGTNVRLEELKNLCILKDEVTIFSRIIDGNHIQHLLVTNLWLANMIFSDYFNQSVSVKIQDSHCRNYGVFFYVNDVQCMATFYKILGNRNTHIEYTNLVAPRFRE